MTGVLSTNRPNASDLLLGRYRLEVRLGSGGSADVWRGVDERLGRPVAIKLLHPHLLPDEAARMRFELEARAVATLTYPGIVTVYDVDATEDGAAIVFELVDGETLADRLAREGALPPGEAARIGAELGEALAHAHERGIVHRDVKPGNVLLERDGRARLVDFGIARLLERETAHLTTAGTITGTLRYLAPEQLAGEEVTAAADVYALGVLLFEMHAGRPPFEASSPVALAAEQRSPPTEIRGVPTDLAAISLEALDPDPAKRPTSASAMAGRLRAWIAGSRVPVVDETTDELRPAPVIVPPATSSSDSTASRADAQTVVVAPVPARAIDLVPKEAAWPLRTGTRGRGVDRRWVGLLAPLIGVALVLTLVGGIVLSGMFAPPAGTPVSAPGASAPASPSASPTPSDSPGRGDSQGKKKGQP